MSAPKIAHWLGATVVVVSTLLFGPTVPASGDPVCTGAMYTIPTQEDMSSPAHLSYPHSGMPAQAATFVAGKL